MSKYLPLQGSNIVIDGNSLATDIYTVGERWSNQLQHQLSRTGIALKSLQNFAVGGQTTTQMAADASTQVDAAFDPACFNLLIFQEGRNQIAVGSTAEQSAWETRSYCAQRRSRGFYVLVMDCYPSNESGMATPMLDYNARIKAEWKTYADAYLDCRRDIPQIQVGPILPDGVHPSATAQCYVAAAVFATIRAIPLRRF